MKYRLFCTRNRHGFIVVIPDELARHIGAAGAFFRAVPSRP